MESWYENGNKRSETIQNPNAKEDEITKRTKLLEGKWKMESWFILEKKWRKFRQ